MSETAEQVTDEQVTLVREFVAADLTVEGRTVDVRVVPFGEVARVADPPRWEVYREEWLPGVFDHQLTAANRIHAKYGHSESVSNVVGHGITMRREADGYHLATKIHQTPQGDTALELLRDGALPSVSLEARPVKNRRTSDGIVQRVKAHLKAFAFCTEGAFAGAQVLAIREAPETTLDEEFLPVDMDPELVERCRRLGVELPQRYMKAHPDDETGTPAETGTPDGSAPAAGDHTNHQGAQGDEHTA